MEGFKNAAYTFAYKKQREEWNFLFNPEHRREKEMNSLSDRWSVEKEYYTTIDNPEIEYNITGCRYIVSDKQNDQAVYSWDCLDDSGAFTTLIQKTTGEEYLIFRRELYGYSVLDLQTIKDFHYYPAATLFNKEETFIWTELFFNSSNNMLAVSGCFWACPWDTLLIDFTDPMTFPGKYLILNNDLWGYNIYEDVQAVGWRRNDLLMKASYESPDDPSKILYKEILITEEEYSNGFTNLK